MNTNNKREIDLPLIEQYADIIYKVIVKNLLPDKSSKSWFRVCYAEVSWHIDNAIPDFTTYYMAYFCAISKLLSEKSTDFNTIFAKSFS